MNSFQKPVTMKTVGEVREYLASRNIDLPLAEMGDHAAMSNPIELFGRTLPNRWSILPMEGWDCERDGAPSAFTERRWLHFAESGASLLCGTEAGAVMHEGRSNPRQLLVSRASLPRLRELVAAMRRRHAELYGTADGLSIGLQLTHSGRYAHPNESARIESRVAYDHPLLARKFRSLTT